MDKTLRLPLIPVFLAYLLGLSSGPFRLPLPPQGSLVLLLPLLALWIAFIVLKKTLWGSCLALASFFLLGIFSIGLYLHPPPSPSHISRYIGSDRIALQGIIDRPPERSHEGVHLLIRSEKVILSHRSTPVDGHVLLFLRSQSEPFRLGDRLRFLCRLSSPQGFRNPGAFSYERYLAFHQIYAIAFPSEKSVCIRIGEEFHNPLLLRIERWRDRIRHFLERESRPPYSGIFEALVLGEQGNIPEGVKEYFIRTGTAHLLAISGDQFGIVALFSFSLLTWLLKRSEFLLLSVDVRKWAAGLTAPFILLYAVLAGGGISVIRAMIMVLVFLLSLLFSRERNLLHTLALAAFLILLFSPPSLFDVSFQLSFLAVLSILYLVPQILRILKRETIPPPPQTSWRQKALEYLRISFLATGVAILGTSPFVALHFNRISPIGFLTNLFVIPWVGLLIVPLSLTASILSFFFYPFATLLIRINELLTLILLKAVTFFASLPVSSFYISTPTPLEIVLFYALLLLAVHLRKGRKIRYLFAVISVILLLDIAFWNLKGAFQKNLILTFLDVGHGDSILIEFPGGKRMLVDGGGLYEDRFDIGKNVVAPFLWDKKIRSIDYLVLTHPDPDHLKGLKFIASHFFIGQFWDNGSYGDSEDDSQLQEILTRKKVERLSLNEKTPPQWINGVHVSFLNPSAAEKLQPRRDSVSLLNNLSLVMKLRFKNVGVLLAADVGREAEYRMMRAGHSLKSDILKIPHHGSASSSTSPFLERVRPAYAILSVGQRNIGRLPNPEVIRRYEDLGCRIFRTDQHGAITLMTDGETTTVMPFLKTGRLSRESQ